MTVNDLQTILEQELETFGDVFDNYIKSMKNLINDNDQATALIVVSLFKGFLETKVDHMDKAIEEIDKMLDEKLRGEVH